MKKHVTITVSLIVVFAILSQILVVSAQFGRPNSMPAPQRPISLEEQTKLEQYNQMIDREFRESVQEFVTAYPSATIYEQSVWVPWRQQETDYWCGPASVQMALLHFGISKTQSFLANGEAGSNDPQLDTNETDGTLPNKVAEVMEKFSRRGYVLRNLSGSDLWNSVWHSLRQGAPVILNLKTMGLDGYYDMDLSHYVVCYRARIRIYDSEGPSAFLRRNSPYTTYTFSYLDPYIPQPNRPNDFKDVTCSYERMYTAVQRNAGYWISK